MKSERTVRTFLALADGGKLTEKQWDRAMDKADREIIRVLQHATKLEGRDHLCHLCLVATAANSINSWNAKRKKKLRRRENGGGK